MSIENSLNRIATALEALVTGKKSDASPIAAPQQGAVLTPAPVTLVKDTPAPPPPAKVVVAPAPPSAPAATVTPAPPVTVDTAAPVVNLTPDELNKALIAEFTRLGSREPIDQVMRAAPFNTQTITDLAPEQYGALIAAVQAVKV